jgi:DMSO/TMAO reductase YedYZ heme-binding membrane subunit
MRPARGRSYPLIARSPLDRGVLAAYVVVAVFGSFWLRRRVGPRAWRPVHYLAFPMLGLVTPHGLLAGTDSASPWMRMTYLAVSAIIIWLSVYRVVTALAGRAASCRTPRSHPGHTGDPRRNGTISPRYL